MNTAQVQAWVQENKTAVLAVAAGGVVVLGLRARKQNATGDGGAGPGALGASLTAGPPVAAGTVPYDSSSSDIYNSLSPLINQLYDVQQQQANTPVPLPEFAPGLYQQAGGDAVYELRGDGTLDWLTQGEWDSMAQDGVYPTVTKATKDSRLWDAQLVGDGSKAWQPTLPADARRFAPGTLVGQAGGQGIYQVTQNGLDWLSQPEFDAMAKNGQYPEVTRLGQSDAVWQRNLEGDGTKAWH